jgi:hypothetical protein
MKELFDSGHIVDLIVALVVIEALAVLGWRFSKGTGPVPLPFIINLLAGTFLMLALRDALVGASWIWIALCQIVALVAHIIDLIWRWEKARSNLTAEPGHTEMSASRRFF